MPFSGTNSQRHFFRLFDIDVPPYTTTARRTVELGAMQHVGRPMVLILTESVSRKSEHDTAWQIIILDRDLSFFFG